MSRDYIVTYGGWYQRTTLHLSEVYDLFALGNSKLDLSKERLKEHCKQLDLKKVTREAGYLEYVKAVTNTGIEIRYYEDGLYILEMSSSDAKESKVLLEKYFQEKMNPALSYIFSLGAPTPKVLANIKYDHPTAVGVTIENPDSHNIDKEKFGEVYSKITSENVTVYKTHDYLFIVTNEEHKNTVLEIIEMQIFFREFKDQLEKYLSIHRNIWEEISNIKEKKYIKSKDVVETRSKLESYKKTISLISNRINQMDSYVHTRQSLAKDMKIKSKLSTLFQYKFDVLLNTHKYINEIWSMTNNYVDSAIKVVVEIENKSTSVGIVTLQKITSVGVISGILGYLASEKIPSISKAGAVYFIMLMVATWLINYSVGLIFRNKKYIIHLTERTKNL